ncbi:MAG: HipA domain-containing protein [Myxococcaceae bacterium]|nr:HipA domain-containing protein [Myxococcaceae bacterium]
MSTADARSVERLDIYRNDERVGSLRRNAEGGSVFEYDAAFFAAHRHLPGGIATHLPYAKPSIESRGVNLPTYFAGLLPEGLRLRALVRRAKTSEDDLFTLLVAAGADCVGDLFPVLPGTNIAPLEAVPEETTPIDQISFADVLERSLVSAHEPSIAGVQEKLSPSMISLPFATRGRKWILKLNPPDKALLVENEHFFMKAAKACGLDAAKTHLVRDRTGQAGLLVERFDRQRINRLWRGMPQEDACQFLDKYPADKYRLSTSAIAEGLQRWCGAPAVECARLIELTAFSYLIGNGDLHAKNVSISGTRGILQLSQPYDLLSTRPYKDLKLALKLEGRDDNLKRRDFIAFGKRHGVAPQAVESRVDRIVAGVEPFIPRLAEIGFEARTTKQLTVLVNKRMADLRDRRR